VIIVDSSWKSFWYW